MKKVIVIFYTVLISLCCLSCSSLNMGNVPFSTTVQLQTYSNREDLILQYPSGELAVKLPIDMALQGFPAVENEIKVTDEVSAFYGWSSKGVQWVIICGRSSANWTPYNVFLSSDKGRTWTPVVIKCVRKRITFFCYNWRGVYFFGTRIYLFSSNYLPRP